jgi:hypothetical protein
MNGSWHYVMENRSLRRQDLAGRMAEREGYARSGRTSSLRARMARRLFELAVVAEREETWRLVWERLEVRNERNCL